MGSDRGAATGLVLGWLVHPGLWVEAQTILDPPPPGHVVVTVGGAGGVMRQFLLGNERGNQANQVSIVLTAESP